MSELKPCPCGRVDPKIQVEDEYAYVRCVCGWRGPCAYSESDDDDTAARAVDLWNRRDAPDEASRAPAPISDEFTVEDADLNDLLNWTASMLSPQTNMDAGIGWMQALEKVQTRLAQSQGGQPATSREQGADHA